MISFLNTVAVASSFVVSMLIALFAFGLVWRERGRRSIAPLAFLLFVVALWLFSKGATAVSVDESMALFWTRVAFASLPIVPFALWQFVVTLVGPTRVEQILFPFIWSAAIGLTAWCQASSLLVAAIEDRSWGYYWSLGPGWIVLLFVLLVIPSAAVLRLVFASAKYEFGAMGRKLQKVAMAVSIAGLSLIDFLPATGVEIPPLAALPVGVSLALLFPLFWRDRFFAIESSFSSNRIIDSIQGCVVVVDLSGKIQLANKAAADLLGASPRTLIGSKINDLIESPQNVGPASDTLMRGDSFSDRPMLWRRKNGGAVQVSVSASMLRRDGGLPEGLIYLATPISDRSRADQVSYQAYHDSLTGLPNRNLYQNQVDEGIEVISKNGRIPAVLFLDIDGFKLVNDSLGQKVGDELLQLISRRLRKALRADDVIARVGGDEFAIFIALQSRSDLDRLVEKVREPLRDAIIVGGEEVFVTACIGAAIWPDHGDDAATLLSSANAALSEAKAMGKDRFVVFGDSIRSKAVQKFSVASNLRKAIENEEFELHYQPILDLTRDVVIGAEALIRWRSHDELLLPGEFMRVAEEAGLIRQIGEWVLREGCQQGRDWEQRLGISKLSINLSAVQMEDHRLVEVVAAELARSGISPHVLELEITETAAMADFEQTIFLLDDLKSLGVSLAMDDFGTGYSSLSYLQRFPIDLLKIDQSFVRDLAPDRNENPIITATIAIARALGLQVTAEGVETAYQFAFLRMEKCDYAQGFGISRALAPADFEGFYSALDYPLKNADLDATRPASSHRP